MFKAHWWKVPELEGRWVANINGQNVEVNEWTGHSPDDGFKPTPTSTYLGYGELISVGDQDLEAVIKSLKAFAKAANFTTAGLPNNSWEGV